MRRQADGRDECRTNVALKGQVEVARGDDDARSRKRERWMMWTLPRNAVLSHAEVWGLTNARL